MIYFFMYLLYMYPFIYVCIYIYKCVLLCVMSIEILWWIYNQGRFLEYGGFISLSEMEISRAWAAKVSELAQEAWSNGEAINPQRPKGLLNDVLNRDRDI